MPDMSLHLSSGEPSLRVQACVATSKAEGLEELHRWARPAGTGVKESMNETDREYT